jgi:predicted GIY-YIG superfamily endonuclease
MGNFRFLRRDVDRRGNPRFYVRRAGWLQARLRQPFGTEEFRAEYEAAVAGLIPKPERPGDAKCCVYVVAADEQPIKVGIAIDPAERLKRLRSGNPARLHLKAVLETTKDRAVRIERTLKAWMRDYRLFGEWFDVPSDEAIALLDRAAERFGGRKVPLGSPTFRGGEIAQ